MLQMWSLLCLCAVGVTQAQLNPQIPGQFIEDGFPGQYAGQLFPDDYDDGLSGGEIPGIAGSDYPVFSEPPPTRFTCDLQLVRGYYADPEAGCQVFHICQDGGKGTPFLCPNGTVFNQEFLVCDWWYNVDCSQAIDFYVVNEEVVRAMEEVDAANLLSKAQGYTGITGPIARQLTPGVSPFLAPGAIAGALALPQVSPFLRPGAIAGPLSRPSISPYIRPGAIAGSLGRNPISPFIRPGTLARPLTRPQISPFGTGIRPGTPVGINSYNTFIPKVVSPFTGSPGGRLLNPKDSYAPVGGPTRYNYPTPQYGPPLPGKGLAPGLVNASNGNFGNGAGPYYATPNGRDRTSPDFNNGPYTNNNYPNRNKFPSTNDIPNTERSYLPPTNNK